MAPKELVAISDGYRESTESWADLLRDLRRRGMRAPVLAVGRRALGFWGALREVFPRPVRQRCWVHKVANVINALPTLGAADGTRGCWPRSARRLDRAAGPPSSALRTSSIRRRGASAVVERRTRCSSPRLPGQHWIHLRSRRSSRRSDRRCPRPRPGLTGGRAGDGVPATSSAAQDRRRAVTGRTSSLSCALVHVREGVSSTANAGSSVAARDHRRNRHRS